MKRLPAIALFAAVLAHGADVYIVAGQSNGYRISSLRPGPTPIPGGHKIYYYGMNCTSEPEYSQYRVLTSLDETAMGSSLAIELVRISAADIVFVQYCRCGSGVWNRTERGWHPEAENGLLARFRKYIAHARESATWDYRLTWNVRALFWHQGESDSNAEHHKSYRDNLTRLFAEFRKDFGATLPIIAGEIRELEDTDRTINRILADVAAADPRVALAKAADLKFASGRDGRPDVHFALEGCQELGRRMATVYRSLR